MSQPVTVRRYHIEAPTGNRVGSVLDFDEEGVADLKREAKLRGWTVVVESSAGYGWREETRIEPGDLDVE